MNRSTHAVTASGVTLLIDSRETVRPVPFVPLFEAETEQRKAHGQTAPGELEGLGTAHLADDDAVRIRSDDR